MKATQRPEYITSPSPKKASPSPKLTLELAREERELTLKAASLSPRIDSAFKAVEDSLKAAYDAQRKFLVDWGYVPRSTGTYEDTRNFYVHPLYAELFDTHYHYWGWDDEYNVPSWAVIEMT